MLSRLQVISYSPSSDWEEFTTPKRLAHINAMPQFESISSDELRWEQYKHDKIANQPESKINSNAFAADSANLMEFEYKLSCKDGLLQAVLKQRDELLEKTKIDTQKHNQTPLPPKESN
jgi:hypothetical protein